MALPSTLLGVTHDNPKIRALHEKLADVTRRIASNDLQIPPEGQRSPSPQPIYDRMGQRLNTREVCSPALQSCISSSAWCCTSALLGFFSLAHKCLLVIPIGAELVACALQERTKTKMGEQRSHFIEELLRADPAYRYAPLAADIPAMLNAGQIS